MSIAITNIGVSGNTSGAALTLSSVTVPANSIIIVLIMEFVAAQPGSMSDSAGNTYSLISNLSINGTGIFYSITGKALSGGTITYTKHTSGTAVSLAASYLTGAALATPDSAVTASVTGTSKTPSLTSGVPSVRNEMLIGLMAYDTVAGIIADGNWVGAPSLGPTEGSGGFNNATVFGGSQLVASPAAKTFAPGLSLNSDWSVFIIGFRPVGTSGMMSVL